MSNEHRRNLPVPFFSQREVAYYWQRIAKDGGEKLKENKKLGIKEDFYTAGDPIGTPVSLAFGSCNITSLCMILHYFGITDDSPDDMLKKFYEDEKIFPDFRKDGYYPDAKLGSPLYPQGPNRLIYRENLMNFAIKAYKVPESYMNINVFKVREIQGKIGAGYPVMISYGALIGGGEPVGGEIVGGNGHIAVVRGFTEQDDVIINDPWGDMSTPYGVLLPKTAGKNGNDVRRFYSTKINGNDAYYGLGNGDNCILRRGEFMNLTRYPKKEGLNWTLVIEYPHIWSFPFRETVANGKGSAEKIVRFSDPGEGKYQGGKREVSGRANKEDAWDGKRQERRVSDIIEFTMARRYTHTPGWQTGIRGRTRSAGCGADKAGQQDAAEREQQLRAGSASGNNRREEERVLQPLYALSRCEYKSANPPQTGVRR